MKQPNLREIIEHRGPFQRALEVVAPSYANRRLQAIVERHLFSYQAAYADRLFSPKSYDVPSENVRTVRERHTLLLEARDLVENFALMCVIPGKIADHCTPTEWSANTGDKGYDRELNDWFHAWCKECDYTGQHSFRQLTALALHMECVDGDCGARDHFSSAGYRVQLYPADLIGNPYEVSSDDAYVAGIWRNPKTGGPASYRLFYRDRNGSYKDHVDVPARYFHHLFDPFRSDQLRGVSRFHSVIRDARMLQGILEAEEVGVRFASQQAALVFNERGSASTRSAFTPTVDQTLASGQTRKDELSDVGLIKYLQHADKVEVMPGRPSSAFQGFVDFLQDKIAIGVGIPAAVLFGSSGYKGPNVRAEFAAADRVWEWKRYQLATRFADPIRTNAITDAIARGELELPPLRQGESAPEALLRACRGEWRWPAKSTIDAGRDSAAALNEHRQGLSSGSRIAAESGYDWYQAIEEKIAEAKHIQERCRAEGIPESVIQLYGSSLPTTPAAAAATGSEVGEAASVAQSGSLQPARADNVIAADFSIAERLEGRPARLHRLEVEVDNHTELRRLMNPGKN